MRALASLIISINILGCSHAPVMERRVELWVGAPEVGGICKASRDEIAGDLGKQTGDISAVFVNGYGENSCLDAKDVAFAEFGCMPMDDIALIQVYIETLKNQCKEWK